MTMKDRDDSFFGVLSNIIDEAFSKVFTEKKEESLPSEKQHGTIEEYTAATGKRFRMTKDQKERGLTREEAFAEIHLNEEN
jgi:hypothetical protein